MGLCTVIVAPSLDGEGSSAVIKEAMMLGTPVVVSDLPGKAPQCRWRRSRHPRIGYRHISGRGRDDAPRFELPP